MENFIFIFLSKRATFHSRVVQLRPMYPLSYISPNYIPLAHPHYIHHTKYKQKVDKTMIYVMIESEVDIRELL